MREILFRAKRTDNKEWIEGSYIKSVVAASPFGYITPSHPTEPTRIYTATLGEFTGQTDKDGKKIFEDDILDCGDRVVYVKWNDLCGTWDSIFIKYKGELLPNCVSAVDWKYRAIIIGNIHDNPELLKDGE
jgi:uncharacterized phage protein (TIGR01671 family)